MVLGATVQARWRRPVAVSVSVRSFVSVFQFSRLERRHLADDAMELKSLDQKGDGSPSMPRNWDADTNGLTDRNGYCKSCCGFIRWERTEAHHSSRTAARRARGDGTTAD